MRVWLVKACAAILCGVAVTAVQAAPTGSAQTEAALIAQGDKHWAAARLDDAARSFEQAVAANPDSVAAHMKLAGLQLSRQDYNRAAQTYQRTISLDAKNSKAWIGLGFAYRHTARSELARAAFEEAARLDPSRKPQLAPLLQQ